MWKEVDGYIFSWEPQRRRSGTLNAKNLANGAEKHYEIRKSGARLQRDRGKNPRAGLEKWQEAVQCWVEKEEEGSSYKIVSRVTHLVDHWSHCARPRWAERKRDLSKSWFEKDNDQGSARYYWVKPRPWGCPGCPQFRIVFFSVLSMMGWVRTNVTEGFFSFEI